MAAPLSLPPAAQVLERTQQRNAVVVGAALYGVSALMVSGTMVGAWASIRSVNHPFPPEGVVKYNYFATVMLFASLMLLVTGEWLVWAVRKGVRRQAAQASGLAVGLLLAMLNGLLYTMRRAGFGAAQHAYGTLFFTFTTIAVLTQVVALIAVLVGLARLGARQISPAEPQLARAVSIASHVAALTWVIAWGAIYAGSR